MAARNSSVGLRLSEGLVINPADGTRNFNYYANKVAIDAIATWGIKHTGFLYTEWNTFYSEPYKKRPLQYFKYSASLTGHQWFRNQNAKQATLTQIRRITNKSNMTDNDYRTIKAQSHSYEIQNYDTTLPGYGYGYSMWKEAWWNDPDMEPKSISSWSREKSISCRIDNLDLEFRKPDPHIVATVRGNLVVTGLPRRDVKIRVYFFGSGDQVSDTTLEPTDDLWGSGAIKVIKAENFNFTKEPDDTYTATFKDNYKFAMSIQEPNGSIVSNFKFHYNVAVEHLVDGVNTLLHSDYRVVYPHRYREILTTNIKDDLVDKKEDYVLTIDKTNGHNDDLYLEHIKLTSGKQTVFKKYYPNIEIKHYDSSLGKHSIVLTIPKVYLQSYTDLDLHIAFRQVREQQLVKIKIKTYE